MVKWEIKTLGHFSGTLQRFLLKQDMRKQFESEVKLHAGDGSLVRVIVEPYDKQKEEENQRSKAQNRYYHKLLDIICDHTGDNHLEMHEKLKIELLGRPYVYKDKEVIIVPSTTELTTKTFGDYLEKVFKFASEEFGLVLPSTNSY